MQGHPLSATNGPGAPPPTAVAGRYEVEELVGRGGMGAVYRVREVATGRALALKRLSSAHERRNAEARRLFEREYRTLSQLSHPGIIRVHDYGVDDGGAFYTMELLDGSDMRELSPLPHPEACACLREVAAALALLHARGLIHRDVTPRNVRRGSDGRCTLIDFGALLDQGQTAPVIGTPPCVPPEALEGAALDHRVDLYALGCLGYWMLTGRHAYPATDTRQLSGLWAQPPPPPSEARPEHGPDGAELPPIPREVDELVMALLRLDPMARPRTAGEVIDRLDALTGRRPGDDGAQAESYLAAAPLAERRGELGSFEAAVGRLGTGQGAAFVLEGPGGIGRSRLLAEMALSAQLRGAAVVRVDAELGERPWALAHAVAAELCTLLPDAARDAARVVGGELTTLVPELRDPGSVPPAPGAESEALLQRTRSHAALRHWVLTLAATHPLVLCIDNVQRADDPSLVWLAGLAHEHAQAPILVVAALRTGEEAEAPAALSAFLGAATHRTNLSGLTPGGLRAWLGSLFGDVAALPRLASHLHERTAGNPAHCMELLRHLVDGGQIVHRDGTWVLPPEPSSLELPSRLEALRRRLKRLDAHAGQLAGALALVRGPLTPELCRRLAREVGVEDAAAQLDVLLEQGVLLAAEHGYRLAHEALREPAIEALEPAALAGLHRTIADAILAREAPHVSEQLRAAVHLLRAGDPRGDRLLCEGALRLADMPHVLGSCTPPLLVALSLYRERGRPPHLLAPLLASLGFAAYAVDRRLGELQDDVIGAFESLTCMPLARRLRPWLGRRLSTYVGLALGGLRYLLLPRSERFGSFSLLVQNFVASLLGLAGRAAICLDRGAIAPITRALEPLVALGKSRAAAFASDYCRGLELVTTDRHATTYAHFLDLERRLRAPGAIPEVTGSARLMWEGGVDYVLGVLESFRGDPRALERARQLEDSGVDVNGLIGAQIRVQYHGFRGEADEVRRAFERLEAYAIQTGTSWQVETWAAMAVNLYGGLWGDVIISKSSCEATERLAPEVPSLLRYAKSSRALYLLLRGMTDECIRLYDEILPAEAPFARIGWSASHGLCAQAHNVRGRHGQALALCERALEGADPGDAPYYAMRLPLEVARVDALVGLSRHDEAERCIEELLARYAGGSPLALGTVHESAARAAHERGDRKAFSRHLGEVERAFCPVGNPSLIARYRELVDLGGSEGGIAAKIATMRKVNAFDRTLGAIHDRDQAARHLLHWLTDRIEGFVAYLIVAGDEGPELLCSSDGSAPDGTVLALVAESLGALGSDADTTMCGTEARTAAGGKAVPQHLYLLSYSDAAGLYGEGALVLVGRSARAPRIRYELLQLAAQHLHRLRPGGDLASTAEG